MQAEADLDRFIGEYLRTDSAAERDKIGAAIERLVNGSIAPVRETLASAKLWEQLPSRFGAFSLAVGGDQHVTVAYSTPPDYEPSRAYPVLLCQPAAGSSAEDTLHLANELFEQSAPQFVFAATDRVLARFHHDGVDRAGDLKALLRELRRRIHTDAARTFLFGVAEGGDAAWMAAIARPDDFAGVIVVSSSPPVPYPRELFSLLLENLRSIPVLSVWTSEESTAETTRPAIVASHNRYLAEHARHETLPIHAVELPPGSDPMGAFPKERALELLGGRRASSGPEISHVFRYPAYGERSWLRTTALHEPIWDAEQLTILPSPQVDGHDFVREVLVQHLGRFHATINGPTLTIDTSKVRRLELHLAETAFDPGEVLTVRCNGTVRFQGPVEPKVAVLLENAYETWDFRRLAAVRIRIAVESESQP